MKILLLMVVTLTTFGCGNLFNNSNQNENKMEPPFTSKAMLREEDFENEVAPSNDGELGLSKKGGSHNCSCTIKKVRYTLGNCEKKLPLFCSDSLSKKTKIIATQKVGSKTGFWFAK